MDAINPLEEARQREITGPTGEKKAGKAKESAFLSKPQMKQGQPKISKTSLGLPQSITGVKGRPEDVAKIEQKTTVRAIEEGKNTIERELRDESSQKPSSTSKTKNLGKKLFGGS